MTTDGSNILERNAQQPRTALLVIFPEYLLRAGLRPGRHGTARIVILLFAGTSLIGREQQMDDSFSHIESFVDSDQSETGH